MKKAFQILLLTLLVVIMLTVPALGQIKSSLEIVIGISPLNFFFFEKGYSGHTYSFGFFYDSLYYSNEYIGFGIHMNGYIDLPKAERTQYSSLVFAFIMETKIPISETLHIIPFKLAIGLKNIFGIGFFAGSGIKIYFSDKFAITVNLSFMMSRYVLLFGDSIYEDIGFGLDIGFVIIFKLK